MELLSSSLREHGFTASIPQQHSFYGWSFTVELPNVSVWLLLQGGEPWILSSEARRGFVDGLIGRKREDEHQRVLNSVEGLLASDSRFSSMEWLTEEEYAAQARARGLRQ